MKDLRAPATKCDPRALLAFNAPGKEVRGLDLRLVVVTLEYYFPRHRNHISAIDNRAIAAAGRSAPPRARFDIVEIV
ncbi:hypothetical protein EVAR_53631_1 [Eumeta japonica]|uniref:Uncharacterized protein n=1 Tax=Eumeta variegata TaxID=151549 RepID=A0A4C1X2L4_EUMVA|nr:hypothetical protein EVAR_53631_1 [Eumeta japonica]